MRTAEDYKLIKDGIECPICGGRMFPVMFTEEERDSHYMLTGRIRRACSHIECLDCGKKEAVDGDFLAEPWRLM